MAFCKPMMLAALGLVLAAAISPGAWAGGLASNSPEVADMARDSGSNTPGMIMPPEPDYEAVIAREFERATAEGTRQALIRFIARHPDHALADRARSLLASPRSDRPGAPPDRADPDADVYAAFDRALQRNTEQGYAEFVGLHPMHPLAEEAQRLRRLLMESGRQ